MNLYITVLAVLIMANSAMSLKCFMENGASAPASFDCSTSAGHLAAPNAKYCGIKRSGGSSIYFCVEEPIPELGINKSSIKETLACYNKTDDPFELLLKGEWCFCSADSCNDPNVATSNTLEKLIPLKCFSGRDYGGEDRTPKANTTCNDGEDRCFNTTTNYGTRYGCMKSYEIRDEVMTDNSCKINEDSTELGDCIKCGGMKSPSDITNCICSSDNCNTSDKIEPIMPHLFQIFAVLIYSTLFKLGM